MKIVRNGRGVKIRPNVSLSLQRLFVLLSLFTFTAVPIVANGFFLSSLGNFFAESVSADERKSHNAQTMPLLQAALNIDPNPAKGGGDITIVGGTALFPEIGPEGTLADIENGAPTSDQISVYVVRRGDTIGGIAKMYGVNVNTIIWGNDLKTSIITEGQTLIILPVSGVRHVVKAGDTIQSIAKIYKGDLKEIMQFNNLSLNEKLSVGYIVIVPDGEVATPPSSRLTSSHRGGGGPDYTGYYMKPVIGARKTQGLHGYNGIDFGAPAGTPVYAAAEGVVILSRSFGWNGGYGKYLVISHPNDTQTLYAHLNENVVFEGANVRQGQLIGFVGSTGKSTGPHLHFEVRGARNPF